MTLTQLFAPSTGGAAPAEQYSYYVGGGEQVMFFILAPLMLLAALGLVFAKNAVHAAMCMAFVMISLAAMYAVQGAQFLFAAQIVVYTGAVMMLFLFVVMLVGVDREESLKETITGNRVATVVAASGLGLILVGLFTGLWGGIFGWEPFNPLPFVSSDVANGQILGPNGEVIVEPNNPRAVAHMVFSHYILAFELVGTLLVIAAVSAITLTHKERLWPRKTQKVQAEERVRAGKYVAGLPNPGVFARHNSVVTPALLPDGTPAEASVSRVLRSRGQDLSAEGLEDPTEAMVHELGADVDGLDDAHPHTKEGDK